MAVCYWHADAEDFSGCYHISIPCLHVTIASIFRLLSLEAMTCSFVLPPSPHASPFQFRLKTKGHSCAEELQNHFRAGIPHRHLVVKSSSEEQFDMQTFIHSSHTLFISTTSSFPHGTTSFNDVIRAKAVGLIATKHKRSHRPSLRSSVGNCGLHPSIDLDQCPVDC